MESYTWIHLRELIGKKLDSSICSVGTLSIIERPQKEKWSIGMDGKRKSEESVLLEYFDDEDNL